MYDCIQEGKNPDVIKYMPIRATAAEASGSPPCSLTRRPACLKQAVAEEARRGWLGGRFAPSCGAGAEVYVA